MSTFQRAKNHWEAEELARKEYFKKYLALPTSVESRKSTKTEWDNIIVEDSIFNILLLQERLS